MHSARNSYCTFMHLRPCGWANGHNKRQRCSGINNMMWPLRAHPLKLERYSETIDERLQLTVFPCKIRQTKTNLHNSRPRNLIRCRTEQGPARAVSFFSLIPLLHRLRLKLIPGSDTGMDYIAIDIEKKCLELAATVRRELETLALISCERCIFRVPDRLRQINERAFTPKVVSIGPLHYARKSLKSMEEQKRRYVRDFLSRSDTSLVSCFKVILEKERQLRGSYAESIELRSDEFVKMVFMDAAFVIEIFLKWDQEEFVDDYIDGLPRLLLDIRFDLCLLENQLPLFILDDLYRLSSPHHQKAPLILLCLKFVLPELGFSISKEDHVVLEERLLTARHIVDLLAIYLGPSSSPARREMKTLDIPSATELHQAGTKFQVAKSKNWFDVRFINGTLEIPKLIVDDSTEVFFRNVMAFEQCSKDDEFRIADYITFMSYLVNSKRDAQLLIGNGIIENWLRDADQVSTLLKSLWHEAIIETQDFHFAGVVECLDAHRKTRRHKWEATLRQNYFKNPWASISIIAAFILLMLTIIQTVCSLLQVI